MTKYSTDYPREKESSHIFGVGGGHSGSWEIQILAKNTTVGKGEHRVGSIVDRK